MEETESLTIVAELAVALAGFAGIVVSLRRRFDDPASFAYARLWRLIEASFGTTFFALLPLALYHLELAPRGVWGISSLGFGVWLLVALGFIFWRFTNQLRSPYMSWRFNGPVFLLQAMLALVLLLNSLGLTTARQFGPYFVGLLGYLIIAGMMFARLLLLRYPEER